MTEYILKLVAIENSVSSITAVETHSIKTMQLHIHSRFQSLARNHCLKFCNQGMILFPSHLALRILGKMEREKPQAAYHRQCLLNKAISVI